MSPMHALQCDAETTYVKGMSLRLFKYRKWSNTHLLALFLGGIGEVPRIFTPWWQVFH